MIRWLTTFALSMLFVFPAFAQEECGPLAKSSAFTPIQEFSKKSCQEIKESKQCQDVYKKIQDNGGDTLKRALVCDSDKGYRRYFPDSLLTAGDVVSGCAVGGWEHVENLGKSIGESVAQFVIDREKREDELAACDKDTKKKKALFESYNSRVPAMIKIESPTESDLAKQSCAKIESDIEIKRRQMSQRAFKKVRGRLNDKSATYTPEEQQFIDWTNMMNTPSQQDNLIELAKKSLKEKGIQYECYNTTYRTALICEAIADVATLVMGPGSAVKGAKVVYEGAAAGAKMSKEAFDALRAASSAKLAELSGVKKVNEFVEDVTNASRKTAGVDGKLTDGAEKARILRQASEFSDGQRVKSAEKLWDRKLSSGEANQLKKMHEVGSSENRGYFTYTKEDLKEKVRLGKEINPETGKPYFTDKEIDTLMRNGLTGNMANVNKATARETYAAKAAKDDYSQYHRLHAEAAAGEGKMSEAKAAYDKAYKSYVKETGVDLKDASTAKRTLANLSERELTQLEDVASSSGNVQQLNEITKAKWNLIEKDIKKSYQNKPGFSDAVSDQVRAEYSKLTEQVRSKNEITQKAAEEKLKALKAVYPGLK